MNLVLHAAPGEVMRAVEQLQGFGRRNGIAEKDLFSAMLALEECASNIVDHALRRDSGRTFTIQINYDGRTLSLELRDGGPEFDPTAFRRPLPTAEDIAGGWGIHLARRSMDEVQYRREGPENVLRLRKVLQRGNDSINAQTLNTKAYGT